MSHFPAILSFYIKKYHDTQNTFVSLFDSLNHESGKQKTNPMIDIMSRICEVLCLNHDSCTGLSEQ